MSPEVLCPGVFLIGIPRDEYNFDSIEEHMLHIEMELGLVIEYIDKRFGKDKRRERHRKRLLPVAPGDEDLAPHPVCGRRYRNDEPTPAVTECSFPKFTAWGFRLVRWMRAERVVVRASPIDIIAECVVRTSSRQLTQDDVV